MPVCQPATRTGQVVIAGGVGVDHLCQQSGHSVGAGQLNCISEISQPSCLHGHVFVCAGRECAAYTGVVEMPHPG